MPSMTTRMASESAMTSTTKSLAKRSRGSASLQGRLCPGRSLGYSGEEFLSFLWQHVGRTTGVDQQSGTIPIVRETPITLSASVFNASLASNPLMAIATFAQKRARVQAISSTIQAEFITAESEDQFKLPALQIEKPASNNQSQHAIPKIGQHLALNLLARQGVAQRSPHQVMSPSSCGLGIQHTHL